MGKLSEKVYAMCLAIERLPASEQQTQISVWASELLKEIADFERSPVSAIEPKTDRDAIIEECAALIEPRGGPPCGCLRPGSYGGCECRNSGDLQQEESYWSAKLDAERIRALKEKL